MKKILRALLIFASIVILVYLLTGFGFHLKWEQALTECRDYRIAQGENVEPPVYGGAMGFIFDLVNWPVYARANMALDGTFFSTPCTK